MRMKKLYEDYPVDELKIDKHVKLGTIYYDNTTDKNRVRVHLYLREDGKNIADLDIIVGCFNKKTQEFRLYQPRAIRDIFQEIKKRGNGKKDNEWFSQDILFKNFLHKVEDYFQDKQPVINRKYLFAWLQGIDFLPDNFKIFVKYNAMAQ